MSDKDVMTPSKTNMAMENPPFEDVFPIEHGDSITLLVFHGTVMVGRVIPRCRVHAYFATAMGTAYVLWQCSLLAWSCAR